MAPRDRREWVAIELDYADNPKILEVGFTGGWAHLRAILYAARHRTDGFVPDAAIWRILHDDMMMSEEADRGLEASMVEAGLWHRVANGYQIHDYLEHQSNAESIREKRARAGRLGGLAKAKKAPSKPRQKKLEVEVDVEVDTETTFLPSPTSSLHQEKEGRREFNNGKPTEADIVAERELGLSQHHPQRDPDEIFIPSAFEGRTL